MNYKEKIEGILDKYIDFAEWNTSAGEQPELMEALVSLYEQAQRDAVEDWMNYLFKEHGEWVELDEARYNNAWEQYLNQTKEDVKGKQ